MATKRRRPVSSEHTTKAKRAKCMYFILDIVFITHRFVVTLENAKLPEVITHGVVLVTGAGDVGQLGLGPDVLEKVEQLFMLKIDNSWLKITVVTVQCLVTPVGWLSPLSARAVAADGDH
ncbi:hypothetical protein NQ317_001531 [Molorchus minor]|uniref:Uncharacterized protein n=1 Tax=Molorchus minor TaxID=1323400 RepID=A0ABQ9J9Q4_9CUCU|nr:hypothetical protein NQ317_001531 [Molorchus minor]